MKRKTMKPLFSAVKKQLSNYAHRKLWRYMVATGLVMCVAHADATSYSDARYYVTATLPDTYDAAGYASTDLVWQEVTLVSDFPQYGAMAEVNRFVPIRGAIKKAKRTPDYGGGNMVFADLPSDAGQAILKTLSTSQAHGSMKIVYPDSETHYLDILVTSFQLAPAKSGDFMVRNVGIEVNKDPVIVAAV